jgi:phosphoglycerate kinase
MGVYEDDKYSQGTAEIARAIARSSALTILGGGDTIGAIHKFGLADRYDFVSAAGSAALEYLSGSALPGLTALGVKP